MASTRSCKTRTAQGTSRAAELPVLAAKAWVLESAVLASPLGCNTSLWGTGPDAPGTVGGGGGGEGVPSPLRKLPFGQ